MDVEFIAQLLQLKSGGEFPALRQTKTADVLREASRIGLLSIDYYNILKESYHFLRRAINGIRIVSERSESKIPETNEKLAKLACKMGHTSENEKKNREDFLDDYARHTRQVREVYKSFFRHC